MEHFLQGCITGGSCVMLVLLFLAWRSSKEKPKHAWQSGDHARVRALDNESAGSHMSTIRFHGQEVIIHDFIDGSAIALIEGNWVTIPLDLLEPLQAVAQDIPAKG